MKDFATQRIENITDVTSMVGRGIQKSIRKYSKEARHLTTSIKDFVDMEDLWKTIDKKVHPKKYQQRRLSSIHTPLVDWSHNSESRFRKKSAFF